MLKSALTAVPPQRWTGWGNESDPVVWSKEITRSDTQYWFGDALLIAGVYEPGVSSARVYLPGRSEDPGFLNTSAPYEFLAAGQWHEISSTWHSSIPVIARIGSAIPIGKTDPTTCIASENAEFPNLAKDDWRGVEIFPPPTTHHASIESEKSNDKSSTSAQEQWFTNDWLEDDGISPEAKADIFSVTIAYAAAAQSIQVKATYSRHGAFEPLWVMGGLNIVLPVGEERVIVSNEGQVRDAGRDEKGRRVWVYTPAE